MTSYIEAHPLVTRSSMLVGILFLAMFAFGTNTEANPPAIPRSKLPQIDRDISGDDPILQLAAMRQLAEIEGGLTRDLERLMPRILELCRSEDDDVLRTAFSIANRFMYAKESREKYGRAVVRAIGDAYKSGSPAGQFAVQTLSEVLAFEHLDLSLPILLAAATSPDEYVRQSSIGKIGPIEDQSVVATLRNALADPVASVRRAAAYAIAGNPTSSTKEAIPELLVAAHDENPGVSASAVHAIGAIGEVEALLKLAVDDDASLRRMAMDRMWSNEWTSRSPSDHFPQVMRIVRKNLTDSDPNVRLGAAICTSLSGDLESRVMAVPILERNAAAEKSLDAWNAFLGVARCIESFAVGLTQDTNADIGFLGIQAFGRDYLKSYLREYHTRIGKHGGGVDFRSVFQKAKENGIKDEHRQLAAEVLLLTELLPSSNPTQPE